MKISKEIYRICGFPATDHILVREGCAHARQRFATKVEMGNTNQTGSRSQAGYCEEDDGEESDKEEDRLRRKFSTKSVKSRIGGNSAATEANLFSPESPTKSRGEGLIAMAEANLAANRHRDHLRSRSSAAASESEDIRLANSSSGMVSSPQPASSADSLALAPAAATGRLSFSMDSEDWIFSLPTPTTPFHSDAFAVAASQEDETKDAGGIPGAALDFGYFELPRGGYIVSTQSMGMIQFGIPPETIKDSLNLGISVPKHFVIQGDMFDRKVGLSKAEFEFPIYYQFFLCRSKVNIITTRGHEQRIRDAMQQTLFGPGKDMNVAEDYAVGTSDSAFPRFEIESAALDPSRELKTLDDVVTFTSFDESTNVAQLGADVEIRLLNQQQLIVAGGNGVRRTPAPLQSHKLMFEVREAGRVIALVPANIKLRPGGGGIVPGGASGGGSTKSNRATLHSKRFAKLQAKKNYEEEERKHLQEKSLNSSGGGGGSGLLGIESRRSSLKSTDAPVLLSRRASTSLLPLSLDSSASLPLPGNNSTGSANTAFAPFDIPVFGITMMGTSHGFDPKGRTTGFVLWMNRRGIMVDPPPDSSQILEAMGIPPLAIGAVILTHVHADHDAGTFQKILRTKQIQLYTTRTIERSFITKYSSITGFDPDFLRSLYRFHPVQCGGGEGIKVYGGEIRFHYSLHTIPCIGLEAHYGPHSLAYSADTRYDPELVRGLFAAGKMGKLRMEQLSAFPHNHSLILYEMGVPPIHTPAENLRRAALDERHYRKGVPLKDRLFVVHTSGDQNHLDFARQCKDWRTIRIMADQGEDKKLSEIISVLSNVDWLQPFSRDMLVSIAKRCNHREYELGEMITTIPEDELSDSVWITMAGQVSTSIMGNRAAAAGGEEEVLGVGDSFGLTGLLDALEMSGRNTLTARSHLKKIPGVPLSIELATASANAIRRGIHVLSASTSEKRLNKLASAPAQPPLHGGDSAGGEEEGAGSDQVFRAKSRRCWVIELPNAVLLKSASSNRALKSEITERLRRFIGWPNDGRWCALQRNTNLFKLLTNQFAVREFLQNLSEEYAIYPEGHVLQSGMDVANSAYFIKEGVFRVLPVGNNMVTSFRSMNSTTADKMGQHDQEDGGGEPFDCSRGSLVGDFNALVKRQTSPYRIVCLEECEVYHLARDQLLGFFKDFPGIKFHLIDRILLGWMLETESIISPRRQSIL